MASPTRITRGSPSRTNYSALNTPRYYNTDNTFGGVSFDEGVAVSSYPSPQQQRRAKPPASELLLLARTPQEAALERRRRETVYHLLLLATVVTFCTATSYIAWLYIDFGAASKLTSKKVRIGDHEVPIWSWLCEIFVSVAAVLVASSLALVFIAGLQLLLSLRLLTRHPAPPTVVVDLIGEGCCCLRHFTVVIWILAVIFFALLLPFNVFRLELDTPAKAIAFVAACTSAFLALAVGLSTVYTYSQLRVPVQPLDETSPNGDHRPAFNLAPGHHNFSTLV